VEFDQILKEKSKSKNSDSPSSFESQHRSSGDKPKSFNAKNVLKIKTHEKENI